MHYQLNYIIDYFFELSLFVVKSDHLVLKTKIFQRI